jgi:hypothetical protein
VPEEAVDNQCPEADDGSRAHDHNDIAYACRHSFVHCIWVSFLTLVLIILRDGETVIL